MALRTGIIGTGAWARETHAPVLTAHPDVEFVGAWGRNRAAADAVVAPFGARAFGALDDLLDAVDAVVLAIPPTAQPDLAVRAARAGCHLLLEKPLALDVAEARRIRDEAAAHDVAGLVFLTSRHRPEQRAWIAAARERGGWHSAHASWLAGLYAPDAPRDPADWRQAKGALWDVGPHALSVTLGVLGPVRAVAATRGLGDTVHLALRHADGPSSTVTLSLTAPVQQSLFTAVGAAGVLPMPTPLSTVRVAAATAVTDLAAMAASGVRTHDADLTFGTEIVEVLAAAEAALGPDPVASTATRPQPR
ncbi:Gfo/Idh/MocA family protein [Pseudonocardia kunmingensis]|uniref:Putative dehydrogenase n=1 Tax=Pseudonocardia kunmingensis TaxID=630975 RepID=A0A543DQL0_9PSEU|nr:Gfo/Idh/MocA family oxidoreductase [Pseudonocardia kunmingensis]TQM11622.1 putative dehydrogenase [Pseudonocardia kunmingensis]